MTPGPEPVRRAGDYVQAGDVRTYYEVHGAGDPLVLLHGGLCTVETFDGLTPTLADRFRVYVPERRGHGRTSRRRRADHLREHVARHRVAFMDALGITAPTWSASATARRWPSTSPSRAPSSSTGSC